MEDVNKLKVAELRQELSTRGLDSKGLKPALVERLKKALDEETNSETPKIAEDPVQEIEGDDTKEDLEQASVPTEIPVDKIIESANEEPTESTNDEPTESTNDEPTESTNDEPTESTNDEPAASIVTEPTESIAEEPVESTLEKPKETNIVESKQISVEPIESTVEDSIESTTEASIITDQKVEPCDKTTDESGATNGISNVESKEPIEEESIKEDESSLKEEKDSEQTGEIKVEESPSVMEDDVAEQITESSKQQLKDENDQDEPIKSEDVEMKEENSQMSTERRGEKRSLSPAGTDEKRPRLELEEVKQDNEPEFNNDIVALDWFNSDLSLEIDEHRLQATPLVKDGFAYIWHGVRSTHGVKAGKTCFEVTIVEELSVPDLEEDEPHPHVVRVGWSVDASPLSLGEHEMSWGFGGTAKASTNLKFKDYGKVFGKGDVVGCFLDMESEPATITYTINGESQGVCFEFNKEDLKDVCLFPHILTKNCSYKVNFGDVDAAFELLADYTFIGKLPLESLERGTQGPENKQDAEIIMMVGLPGSGKTTWVNKYCLENPDKKYNILGTNALLDKMKVMGLPRKRNYSGRWENLIEKCTRCLNKLLSMAYKRRRNFIIDQTNVYPTAQRRKMKGFEGFQRRAIVICPPEEELKLRIQKREADEGKSVPDKAILDMKANYKLPSVGESFDTVEFIELQKDEADTLIQIYVKEGEDAGFGAKQRPRNYSSNSRPISNRTSYNDRQRRDNKTSYRGSWDRDRDRRGSYDRRDRGGGAPAAGGWNRDSRDYRSRDTRQGGYKDNRGGGGYQQRDRYSRASGGYNSSGWQGNRGGQSGQYNQGSWGDQGNQWNSNPGWGSNSSASSGQQAQGGYGANWNQNYYSQNQGSQNTSSATPAPTTGQQTQYWTNQQSYGQQPQQNYNTAASSYSTQQSGSHQSYNYNQPQQQQQQTTQQPQQQPWGNYNQNYSYNQSYNRK